jgi:hypothetical protein
MPLRKNKTPFGRIKPKTTTAEYALCKRVKNITTGVSQIIEMRIAQRRMFERPEKFKDRYRWRAKVVQLFFSEALNALNDILNRIEELIYITEWVYDSLKVKKIYSNIAANAVSAFDINTEHVSFDTTSINVHGDYDLYEMEIQVWKVGQKEAICRNLWAWIIS